MLMRHWSWLCFVLVISGCSNVQNEKQTALESSQDTTTEIVLQQHTEERPPVDAYLEALQVYLRKAKEQFHFVPDTLLVGRHPEFPEIDLAGKIGTTMIEMLPYEKTLSDFHRPACHYVNLMGWQTKDEEEFLFVVFHDGFHPLHQCSIMLVRKPDGSYKLESEKLEKITPASKG